MMPYADYSAERSSQLSALSYLFSLNSRFPCLLRLNSCGSFGNAVHLGWNQSIVAKLLFG
jgi:hypothetical protein